MSMDRKRVQMERHSANIQRETKAALIQFKESGVRIDGDFIKYFLKHSIESMTETCERFRSDTSKGSGGRDNKRKSDTANKDIEQTKKQKPFSSNSIDGTVFFCDFCTDRNDASQSFSGTVDEVREHWMSFHLNRSMYQPLQKHTIQNVTQQMNTIFFCDHCSEPSDSCKLFSGTVDQVYDHWLTSHLNESISLPFQFHAIDLIKCFHCGEVGAYHDLVEHHKNQHLDKLFTISDRMNSTKCGICQFQGGNLIEHFKSSHESVSPPNTFNQVLYSEKRITELLDIVAEKEHRCIKCNQTFRTHTETYKHFAISHIGQVIELNPFVGGRRQPAYLICGFCKKFVDVNHYLSHFKTHSYNFKCSKCAFRSSDLAELMFHERHVHSKDSLSYHCSVFPDWLRNKFHNTKLVFGNGLVLKNYNVLKTKFDDSKSFNIFIDGILDAKKECLEQMMKMNTANQQMNLSNYHVDPSNHQMNPSNQQMNPANDHVNPSLIAVKKEASTDDSVIAELNKQRNLQNNLFVEGIPANQSPQNAFLKLCSYLGVNVLPNDIKQITVKNGTIISVTLKKFDVKKNIQNRMRMKNRVIWSNEFLQLSPREKPWKILVYNELTPFYMEISRAAMALRKTNALYKFKIDNDGLMVKRTPTDAGHTVRSKQELFDYINKT